MSIKSFFSKLFRHKEHIIQSEPVTNSKYEYYTQFKKQYKNKKVAIHNWLKDYLDHYCAKNSIDFSLDNYNLVCPNCMSSNVDIKTIKIAKDLSTEDIKYNHCNDCETDWEYNDKNYLDLYCKYSDVANFLDYIAIHLILGRFDPYDITCECDTKEEYQEMHLNYLKNHHKDLIENFPIEVVHYLAYNDYQCIFMTEEIFGSDHVGYDTTNDKGYDVLGTFTPEMENILVNLLKMKRLN